ncbi:MAG: hypothetical protein DRP45_04360 [Candidatus Zixiibacteriota bacterium]|nr:MAG: hypothetical protein DRP45_04360 [candidate division Zixibacteria bacterium]
MTCGGCEKGVATCLEKTDGVVKVGTVSHKESYAVVVVDTKDGSDEALIEAVTEKGYKAKVMAFADDAKTTAVAGCIGSKKGCSAKCGVRAACGTKTASKKAADSESK